MKIAYFDCFSGISGDMILGALIDLGLDVDFLKKELKKLKIDFEIKVSKVVKNGISATKFDVVTKEEHHHRHLEDITKILDDADLDKEIKENAKIIFNKIAVAEAKIHNININEVHFHEIGAVDTIVDIVGVVIGIKKLGIEKIYCSRLNVGKGFVNISHGVYPVPAPATLELLKKISIYNNDVDFELVTPTGAAIITHFAKYFGSMPEIRIENIGYGAGNKDLEQPNVLRILFGEQNNDFDEDVIDVIETNIDNMNPELYSNLIEKIIEQGALDSYMTSVVMKKGRIGILLTTLCNTSNTEKIIKTIFEESTTIGVRIYQVKRKKLKRDIKEIHTSYGNIKVKFSRFGDKIINRSPEFEDCKKAAEKYKVPLKDVYSELEKVL